MKKTPHPFTFEEMLIVCLLLWIAVTIAADLTP